MSPLIFVATAAIGQPAAVLCADDPDAAADAVRALGVAEVEPIRWSGLLGDQPIRVLGGGSLRGCATRTGTNAWLAGLLRDAEGAMRYLELDVAQDALDRAAQSVGCLAEPVDPALAAEVFFLRGVIAETTGDGNAARSAFERALTFAPDLEWDPDLAPDALPTFLAVARDHAARPPVALRVVPSPPAGGWSVDGLPRGAGPVQVVPGDHVVVFGSLAWELPVEQATHVLVAGDMPDPSDPDAAMELLSVLAVLAPTRPAYVVAHGDVWERQGEVLVPRLAPPPPPRRSGVRQLRWAGALVAVGGGALSAMSWVQGQDAVRDAGRAESWSDYDDAVVRRDRAAGRLLAGEVTAGAGTVLFTIGFAAGPR